MSRLAFGVAAAVTVFIAAGFVTLAYPFIYRQPLAESFLEVDGAEGKAWLDTRIVIEIRGSLSEDQVRESLGIYPPVRLGEEDLKVEHIAKLPWHERFPWAKTRVSINPHKARLFEPETGYTVVLNDKRLTFETITLPRVVDARVDSILHHNFFAGLPAAPLIRVVTGAPAHHGAKQRRALVATFNRYVDRRIGSGESPFIRNE